MTRAIRLTPALTAILAALVARPDEVLTAAECLGDGASVNPKALFSVQIHHLRRAMEQMGHPSVIITVKGVGYRLVSRSDSGVSSPVAAVSADAVTSPASASIAESEYQ